MNLLSMKIGSLNLDNVESVAWVENSNCLRLLDQRLLPWEIVFVDINNVDDVVSAIRDMTVRGAPAIGITAAYGMVIAVKEIYSITDMKEKKEKLKLYYHQLLDSRPTAIDLYNYATIIYNKALDTNFSFSEVLVKAHELKNKVTNECKVIGIKGAELINDGDTILTHCNAGATATVDYGTALAPLFQAQEDNKKFKVIVDETRPRLQGAKITAWELSEAGIEHYIIADSSAAFMMSKGLINKIIVGADRCLRNGSITNKIGTLSLAITANYYKIPFYVAFPWSTIDYNSKDERAVIIEQRSDEEVKYVQGKEGKVMIANASSDVINYAFDITPAELITGYITPSGILRVEELKNKILILQNSQNKNKK